MPELKEAMRQLESATLDLCWGQWTSAGVAGVRESTRSIVDPEALTLLSVGLSTEDPRLMGEMLDWLVLNAHAVDLSRLRRMQQSATPRTRRQIADLARQLADATPKVRSGWASIAREGDATEHGIPLAAEESAAWGASRGPELRGMSREPKGDSGSGARFRARALLGIGARAETIVYLWTHEWVHGRLVAERAVYNQAPVAAYLAQLASAGLAERRPKGNRVLYRASQSLRELGLPGAEYVDWASACRGVARILEASAGQPTTEVLAVSVARGLMEGADDLAAEGFGFHVPDLTGWARQGATALVAVVQDLTKRLQYFAR